MIWLGLDGFLIGMAVGQVIDLGLRGRYLRRLFPEFSMVRHLLRAIAPHVLPVAVVLGLRAMDGSAARDPAIVMMELIAYVGLTAAISWLTERELLSEALGFLRRARRAAPSTG